MNVVVLEGRLTKDVELKQTQTGVSVASVTVAVKRDYPTGENAITDFIDVVVWRKTAEFVARYFKKGDGIALRGELQTRTYTDKDGNNRKAVEVVADKVEFPCGKAKEKPQGDVLNTTEGASLTADVKAAVSGGFEALKDDEDLPF